MTSSVSSMRRTTLTSTDPPTPSTKASGSVQGSPGGSGSVVTQIVTQWAYGSIKSPIERVGRSGERPWSLAGAKDPRGKPRGRGRVSLRGWTYASVAVGRSDSFTS